jgi:hypothetical protein
VIATKKFKNIVLMALASTFILSMVSLTVQQQGFAQGFFQSERNQSSTPISTNEENDEQSMVKSAIEADQKIILGNITIPIDSKTHLSLEMPNSLISVEPNQ